MEEQEENEGKESKIARFKNHFKRNKETYLWVGVTAVTSSAVTVAFYLLKNGRPGNAVINEIVADITGTGHGNVQNIHYKTQTISIYGKKVGRPGIPIWDETTGKRYESLTLAADAIGASVNNVREQLHGRTDHINGHRFVLAE